MRPLLPVLLLLVCTIRMHAQDASPPGEPMVFGLPPDERVDVTGDGVPDLVITGRIERRTDTEQGLAGIYLRSVKTLPGCAVLQWSTPSTQRFFTLADSARLDTALLGKRAYFKQVSWTPSDGSVEFPLLERPFGPGISQAQDGWYGTGHHFEGTTMVLRSTTGAGAGIAAFKPWFLLPSGRIGITGSQAIAVPKAFAVVVDPPRPADPVDDLYSFGHENTPQVIVPPGLPPDEMVDLNGDEVTDVVITGQLVPYHGSGDPGYYVRGVAPAAGTSFLMVRDEGQGPWICYRLPFGEPLTPEELSMGLHSGRFMWSLPTTSNTMCPVLHHPYGSMDTPPEWAATDHAGDGDLVYRTTYYGQVLIGALELNYMVPGGELGVRAQNWVEEGQVLQVR